MNCGETNHRDVPLWNAMRKGPPARLPGDLEDAQEAVIIPVILPLTAGGAGIARRVSVCGGLFFAAGQGDSPQLYREDNGTRLQRTLPAGDLLQRELLNKALSRTKGICRGTQILDTALGCTLFWDFPTEYSLEIRRSVKQPYDSAVGTAHILLPLATLPQEAEVDASRRQGAIKLRSERCGVPRGADSGMGKGRRKHAAFGGPFMTAFLLDPAPLTPLHCPQRRRRGSWMR